ncbi:MAG: hypothetical protein IJU71_11455 [Selenomonadaceae bacterium]|nr:hypothetical protein [Selenomonadaceae bacterium]
MGRLGLIFKAAALDWKQSAAVVECRDGAAHFLLTNDALSSANRYRLKEIFKGIMQVAAKIYAQVIFFDRRSLCA